VPLGKPQRQIALLFQEKVPSNRWKRLSSLTLECTTLKCIFFVCFYSVLVSDVVWFSSAELQQCCGACRITPVDVNSRPSSCLTNFLLTGLCSTFYDFNRTGDRSSAEKTSEITSVCGDCGRCLFIVETSCAKHCGIHHRLVQL